MSTVKSLAKDWLPPAVKRLLRNLRCDGIRFEGEFATWEDAAGHCTGYDAEHILAKVLDATLKVKRGEAAFERDSVLFDEIEYTWPVTAGLMWAAARSGGGLSVLDFGGALGSSYYQNKRFLDSLANVHWNVVEQAHYVKAGQLHIQDDRLHFFTSIEACLEVNKPNVVLLSSVFQYLKRPLDVLERLSKAGALYLIIDRTPFSNLDGDRLVVQRVPSNIYAASYPMWVLSNAGFLKNAQKQWHLVVKYISPEGAMRTNRNLNFEFQGMIFESNHDK